MTPAHMATTPRVRGKPVLTLDIGGTKTTAAVVDLAGSDPCDASTGALPHGPSAVVLDFVTASTPALAGPKAVLTSALRLAEQAISRTGLRPTSIGIASAGVIDSYEGVVTHATSSLASWAGTDVANPFRQRYSIPVHVLNDVHAHGLGEALFGVGRTRSSLLLIAAGTGIGGAHIIGRHPVTGFHGAAGHLGHLPVSEAEGVPCPCGRTGHLEGLASGPGITALARRLGHRAENGHQLAASAHAGDPVACSAYRIAGHATGRVIGAVLNMLDVEVVALTGGVAKVGAPWRDALRTGIAQEAMDVVSTTAVEDALAGEHAALLGAAAFTLRH